MVGVVASVSCCTQVCDIVWFECWVCLASPSSTCIVMCVPLEPVLAELVQVDVLALGVFSSCLSDCILIVGKVAERF